MSVIPETCNASLAGVSVAIDTVHIAPDGAVNDRLSVVVEEVPVAFRYGGLPHAVMMATPANLTDFAVGFSVTEGTADSVSSIRHIDIVRGEDGIALDISLTPDCMRRYLRDVRVRRLQGHTGCGICGIEDFSDLKPSPRRVSASPPIALDQIASAMENLRAHQPLSRSTHGAHAAAWIGLDGGIVSAREDVGRHNALDKLIGAGLRGAFSPGEGFCLITSRCSYEMANKAVRAGYSALVSVSAPTALAIRTAAAAGLTLYSLAGRDGQLRYTTPKSTESANGKTQI